jgi:hypothetical protein
VKTASSTVSVPLIVGGLKSQSGRLSEEAFLYHFRDTISGRHTALHLSLALHFCSKFCVSIHYHNMFFLILLAAIASYAGWSFVSMEVNYHKARSMGIPLVRLPIDPMNVIWVVLEPQVWSFLDRLPIDFGSFGRYSRRGWFFADKAQSHVLYGPIWALVSPRDIYIYVADANAVHDIFSRREDFLRPSKMYSMHFHGCTLSTR